MYFEPGNTNTKCISTLWLIVAGYCMLGCMLQVNQRGNGRHITCLPGITTEASTAVACVALGDTAMGEVATGGSAADRQRDPGEGGQ